VASTEGSDSMPSEIVSAIMTVARLASCLMALGGMVLVLFTHTSLPARADNLELAIIMRLSEAHHHSRVLYLH
jgi:hypothetical protein